LDEEIADIFTASQEVDAGRRTAIAKAVMERAGQIELLQSDQKKSVIAAIREHKRDSTEMPRGKSNRQSRQER
jgi:SH3-like domain-containing protein